MVSGRAAARRPGGSAFIHREKVPMQLRIAFVAGLVAAASWSSAQAAGDSQQGEAVFKKTCAICHTTEAGQNKIGARLPHIVGRDSAAPPKFPDSAAMEKAR